MLRLTAAIATALLLTQEALACSCLYPEDMTEAEARTTLEEYEILDGTLAQFVREPDCETGRDGSLYQAYVLATDDGRSVEVRQPADRMGGRCTARSSAACGATLPPSGQYILKPVSTGVYAYPMACELVSAGRALEVLGQGAAPAGDDADNAADDDVDPCDVPE